MLQTPGLLPLWAASAVGRLPTGALGVLLLLRTREMTGSYAAGGAVAAAYGLAMGVGQPLLGRLIDRRGQTVILLPSGVAAGALIAVLAALPDPTPVAVVVGVAAVAGAATPPLNSCLRALLADVVAPALRHRAFALDSTVFELVYITGPLLLVGFVGAWSLRAALAACGALTAFGTVVFAATRLSRVSQAAPDPSTDLVGPLRDRHVRTLLMAVGLFGLSIANLEIGLAAFASDEGSRSAVGYLLALSGAGSMVGGLAAARAPAPADPRRRLVVLLVVLAVLEAPLAVMPSLATMGAMVAVASVAIAPSLALTYQLATEAAPAGTVTETLTWLSSAISAGVAAGAALAGVLAEHASTAIVLAGIAAYTAVEAIVVAART